MFERLHWKMSGLLCLISLLWLVAGCSYPTQREIGAAYKQEIDQLVSDFRAISAEIPRDEVVLAAKSLDPPPYYHIADPMSNMAVMSKQELAGDTPDINDPHNFSLITTAEIESRLEGRFEAVPPEDAAQFEAAMRSLANMPYVLAYDLIDFKPAVLTESTFEISPMRMAVSLYDRRTKQWLACKLFEFSPPEAIEFEHKKWAKEATAHSELGHHFRKQAYKQLAQYVAESLGGEAVFDIDAAVRSSN